MPRWLRALLALAAGLALFAVLLTRAQGHRLTRVPVLTVNLAPGDAVTPQDITWAGMVSPPPGLASAALLRSDPVAVIPLRSGQLVTATDVAPAPGFVPRPGEVALTVAVSGAASGLVTPGDRVDVWSMGTSASSTGNASSGGSTGGKAASGPTPLLLGARVLAIATSSGAPVTSGASIGLVTLAVPASAVASVLAAPAVYLVPDAFARQVTVATGP
jgi:Flp pilus assembly protein CpaB